MDILNPERGQKLAFFGQTWYQRPQKAILNDKKNQDRLLLHICLRMKASLNETKLKKNSNVHITCRFNDKILGYHFLVHEGCVIMMFYVPKAPKSGLSQGLKICGVGPVVICWA